MSLISDDEVDHLMRNLQLQQSAIERGQYWMIHNQSVISDLICKFMLIYKTSAPFTKIYLRNFQMLLAPGCII